MNQNGGGECSGDPMNCFFYVNPRLSHMLIALFIIPMPFAAMTAILMRHDGAVAERRLSAISIFSHMDFSPATPLKPFGELRRAKAEKGERKKARLEESTQQPVAAMDHMGKLPDNLWARIGNQLGALERMRLSQCCKRMRQLFGRWEDVQALEIKPDWAGGEQRGFCIL